ncbi:MAG TPA: ABC transporter ATP-binding protein [Prolixibacteraceae bacterium]|nr:ABC transporter ATP-binding protein [Prolixibacteraceae bacterium]HPS14114.1 ABC transporter ATP-binding protein [Prolixibacteraceae bacterium]
MAKLFPEIILKDLTVGYRSKKEEKILLDGITTQLLPGEIIALMGNNGCGKSTLLRTLTGFQHPLSGEVLLNNKPISTFPMQEKARFISYVSTEPVQIGNMTVFDLVGLGRYLYSGWWGNLSEDDIKMVRHCLSLTRMLDFENRQLISLSDGERQRVMIARALAQDTPLIILDEPTAFLDVRNKYEIIHLLRELARTEQKSVIFSTHDFSISLGIADKIWLIDQKKIIEGAPEDLALNELFQPLFAGSTITFHPQTGEIILTEKTRRKICLRATGNEKIWLSKALLRNGITEDPASEWIIDIETTDGETHYILEKNGTSYRCATIYELVKLLKQSEKE